MTQRSAQREKSWYIGGGTRESHTFGVYFLCFEFRSENGRGFEAQPFSKTRQKICILFSLKERVILIGFLDSRNREMSHLSEPSAPPNKLARTSCMLQHDNVMQMHHDLP